MRTRDYLWIALGVLAVFLIFLSADPKNDFVNVGAEEVEKMINEIDVFVLQVHEPYQGELPNTDLIIEDWENIENHLDELPSKDSKILVYCRSGRMSSIVSEKLSSLGYENIYNFEGGMKAWETSERRLMFLNRR